MFIDHDEMLRRSKEMVLESKKLRDECIVTCVRTKETIASTIEILKQSMVCKVSGMTVPWKDEKK